MVNNLLSVDWSHSSLLSLLPHPFSSISSVPAMPVRTTSDPATQNASLGGHTRPPPLDTSNGSAPMERPQLSGTSAVSSPGGALSGDKRYGAAYDDSVVPPSHPFRTLVVAYDGTGDQFDDDVSAYYRIRRHHCLEAHVPRCRTRTSCSSFLCSRRMIVVSRWSTIRSDTYP